MKRFFYQHHVSFISPVNVSTDNDHLSRSISKVGAPQVTHILLTLTIKQKKKKKRGLCGTDRKRLN